MPSSALAIASSPTSQAPWAASRPSNRKPTVHTTIAWIAASTPNARP